MIDPIDDTHRRAVRSLSSLVGSEEQGLFVGRGGSPICAVWLYRPRAERPRLQRRGRRLFEVEDLGVERKLAVVGSGKFGWVDVGSFAGEYRIVRGDDTVPSE